MPPDIRRHLRTVDVDNLFGGDIGEIAQTASAAHQLLRAQRGDSAASGWILEAGDGAASRQDGDARHYSSRRTRCASLSPMKMRPFLSMKMPCGRAILHWSGSPSGPSPRCPVPAAVEMMPVFKSMRRMVWLSVSAM